MREDADELALTYDERRADVSRRHLEHHRIEARANVDDVRTARTNRAHLHVGGAKRPEHGLANLKSLGRLKELNLFRVPVTDDDLASLAGLTDLERLYLSDTRVTDAGLPQLRGLGKLHTLGLSSTSVSDAGLTHLYGLASLRNISLLHAQVTDEGVTRLKQALPGLDVYYR